MAEVDIKTRPAAIFGALAGLVLLLFAGALLADPSLGRNVSFRGRRLNATVVAETTLAVAVPATGTSVLTVASIVDFAPGQELEITDLTAKLTEVRRISLVLEVEKQIVMKVPLVNVYPLGSRVRVLEESLVKQSMHQSSSGSSGSLKPSASSASSLEPFKSIESGSFKDDLQKTGTASTAGTSAGSFFVNLLIMICYGCIYHSKVVEPMGVMNPKSSSGDGPDDFNYGLCDCLKDPSYCLMTSCCPLIRIAHTNAVAGVCGFWETLMCLWCSTALCGLGPCCLNVYFRIHVKENMGIEDHCVNDMCLAWLCLPCITGQQALAVDDAMGFRFSCPCTVKRTFGGGGEYGGAFS